MHKSEDTYFKVLNFKVFYCQVTKLSSKAVKKYLMADLAWHLGTIPVVFLSEVYALYQAVLWILQNIHLLIDEEIINLYKDTRRVSCGAVVITYG